MSNMNVFCSGSRPGEEESARQPERVSTWFMNEQIVIDRETAEAIELLKKTRVMLIYGGPRSGRTTLMRSMARAAMERASLDIEPIKSVKVVEKPGYTETTFSYNKIYMRMIDITRQDSNWKKWITYFNGIPVLGYVVDLTSYMRSHVAANGSIENELNESFHVFKDLMQENHYDYQTAVILYLTKIDMFEEALKRVPLTQCFENYTGTNAKEALNFILRKFRSCNPQFFIRHKIIYSITTSSWDSNNLKHTMKHITVHPLVLERRARQTPC